MRLAALVLSLTAVWTGIARARCGDLPGDQAAVAAARAAAAIACDCATAPAHVAHVRCVRAMVGARIADGSLPAGCGIVVQRCAQKSTCGRSGAVACCRTNLATSVSKCSIVRSAAGCEPRGPAGVACVSPHASCCEACGSGGCATTTTTTSTTTTTTSTIPYVPCGGPTGACDGACPQGSHCVNQPPSAPDPLCACLPDDVTPCGTAGYPTCGGACTNGADDAPRVCQPWEIQPIYGDFTTVVRTCVCVPAASTCATCGAPGRCTGGAVCSQYAGPFPHAPYPFCGCTGPS